MTGYVLAQLVSAQPQAPSYSWLALAMAHSAKGSLGSLLLTVGLMNVPQWSYAIGPASSSQPFDARHGDAADTFAASRKCHSWGIGKPLAPCPTC
jgi:hypothetical protein